jgi:hypothetical protein
MHHGLMTKPRQRISQFDGVHHAAARIGRMRKNGNP